MWLSLENASIHERELLMRVLVAAILALAAAPALAETPVRARDLGVPFDGTPGKFNAITDVAGVAVGMKTLISGHGRLVVGQGPVRTGVTAILPRGQNDHAAVFAGYFAGNGNGDMTGTHWIEESGLLETPILITNTGSVGVVRDAAVKWLVQHQVPGDFWYPVSAETADVPLNDIRGQHVTTQDALDALNAAQPGPVAEGNVGGGTGMICNGFKGGTGTASRVLPAEDGGYTIGVLVQCNYGIRYDLRIAGIPVAREMTVDAPCVEQQYTPPIPDWDGTPAPVCGQKHAAKAASGRLPEQGSIIVIVGTDAPLTPDQLKRLARRVSVGLGRLGAVEHDESGDIFLAFSTANRGADDGNSAAPPYTGPNATVTRMQSWRMDPIFYAVVQATEEAVVNTLIAARTMTGADGWVIPALPQDQLQTVLKRHGLLQTPK
jgi:L-aminopeptidase/D-esterase-like protein